MDLGSSRRGPAGVRSRAACGASSIAAAAALLVLVAGSPAAAEGNYSVRNATGRALTCGLRQERRSVIERFVLGAGREWRRTSAGDGERVLLCDSWKFTDRWRVRSGVPYVLSNDPHSGRVTLHIASAAQ